MKAAPGLIVFHAGLALWLWFCITAFGGDAPFAGLSLREAAWGAGALGAAVFATRRLRPGALSPAEPVRWILLLAAVTLVFLPFFRAGSLGAGDAYWYTAMLADFVTQVREGVFPVWTGQSIHAFNGAVFPVRMAPAFQHIGGILDTLTFRSLEFTALKNLTIAAAAIGGAFAAYFSFRAMQRANAWLALLLSVLWIASPGVVAPGFSGDLYMTVMTLPFVPLVLYGCWRVWERDDAWARAWIVIGLAGCLLGHPPIGLWMALAAGVLYLIPLCARRRWRAELRWLGLMAAGYLALVGVTFASALALEPGVQVRPAGELVLLEIARHFPYNFLPIDPAAAGLYAYQIGYALLVVFVLALLIQGWRRARAAWGFVALGFAIAPLTLPVPGLTSLLWTRLIPDWFIAINNVWPMQRLFLIWTAVIAFAFAAACAALPADRRRWLPWALTAVLAAGAAWSGLELRKLASVVLRGSGSPADARREIDPDNAVLTRYAYTYTGPTPSHVSHGYMEPWLENRLLDRQTLLPFVSNAEAAAPPIDLDTGTAAHPRLVQTGTFTARSDNGTDIHILSPRLELEPNRRYALRLSHFIPSLGGHLQVFDGSLFREYILPDSGSGLTTGRPPRAFGTTPTSSAVMPLYVREPAPDGPKFNLITSRRPEDPFSFARFLLYTYDRSSLPIAVDSWIPYRARTEAAVATYLETPRLWLKGWRARVNGADVPTARSPDNLVMIPLEPGRSEVELNYSPGPLLRTAAWLSILSWLLLLILGFAHLRRAGEQREQSESGRVQEPKKPLPVPGPSKTG